MKPLACERRWIRAIFAAVLPGCDDPRFPAGAEALGAERYVDALLGTAPRGFARGLRACTWLLQLAPPFVLGRFAVFSALPLGARSELLERMTRSDLYLVRELPMLFKTAACLGLCGLPEAQRRIGIHPVDAVDPDWARRLPLATGDRP